VRIIVHPEPIHVSYKNVRDLVPKLWDQEEKHRKFDAVVHIGMAGPRPMYQIERRGHRDGYKSRDVDGELLGDQDLAGQHEEGWYWEDMPEELTSEFDMEDVLARWKHHSPVGLLSILKPYEVDSDVCADLLW
jgi:hypothetical protein